MSRIGRRFSMQSSQAGVTIYVTMLIVSCVALAVAVFFPAYEYFDLQYEVVIGAGPSVTTRPPPEGETEPPDTEPTDGEEGAEETEPPEGEGPAEPAEGAEEPAGGDEAPEPVE